jgi:hypothetical protein
MGDDADRLRWYRFCCLSTEEEGSLGRLLICGEAVKPKHPPGSAMKLGNMRELGVQRSIASCLNDVCDRIKGVIACPFC